MPPSIRAFTQFWKNSFTAASRGTTTWSAASLGRRAGLLRAASRGLVTHRETWSSLAVRAFNGQAELLRVHDLAAVDPNQVDAGHTLAALLARGPLLDKCDVAVDAL